MPIIVAKHGKKWVVVNKDTGKIHGTFRNPKQAYRQISAMKHNGVDISGKGEKKPEA